MIHLQVLITILVVHFLADFALQTQWQAENKSSNAKALIEHVVAYSAVWFFISFGILGTWWKPIIFAMITFAVHLNIDYHSSRLTKGLFEKKDYHNAFVVVGADQVLHYVQLFLTYWILK